MKIVAGIYTNKQLEELAPYIDSAILMTPHYAYVYKDLDLESAILFCRKKGIEPIISLTRIFMENEISAIKVFINKYINEKFIVSDLGLIQIFKEKNLLNNVIYDPTTLVCNSMDLKIYNSLGFKAVGMSNEITINDVIASYEKTNANIHYQVFGRKMMYYSKRRLISTYKEYRDLSFECKHLFLREEKRNYDIPVYENENGTYCFRHYNVSLLKDIDRLTFIKNAYFETLNIDPEDMVNVLKIYRSVINKEITVEEGLEQIDKLSLPIEDGFSYSDTVHVKEKIVQCER